MRKVVVLVLTAGLLSGCALTGMQAVADQSAQQEARIAALEQAAESGNNSNVDERLAKLEESNAKLTELCEQTVKLCEEMKNQQARFERNLGETLKTAMREEAEAQEQREQEERQAERDARRAEWEQERAERDARRTDEFIQQLGIEDDEQAEKVKTVIADMNKARQAAMEELRSGGNFDREKMTEIMTDLMSDTEAAMKEVLTPEQFEAFTEARDSLMRGGGRGQGGGRGDRTAPGGDDRQRPTPPDGQMPSDEPR